MVHRMTLDKEGFELPDQSHFFHNLILLVLTGRLPLDSMAFNILCSNIRGICTRVDFKGTGYRYNKLSGLIEPRRHNGSSEEVKLNKAA